MKKSVKKLNLNKMSILHLNEISAILGGIERAASGVQGCGGAKTQPECPTTITAND